MSLLQQVIHRLLVGPDTVDGPGPDPLGLAKLGEAVGQRARARLGRSLAIREVDAGSCNGCELEVNAVNGPVYDLERFGIRFVASPRHADVLLVTGPVGRNMAVALKRTYDAVPEPKWVVAMGDCAVDGGCFAGTYAVCDGVRTVLPVDLTIPGCPPTPEQLLGGLLALLETVAAPPVPPADAETQGEEAASVE